MPPSTPCQNYHLKVGENLPKPGEVTDDTPEADVYMIDMGESLRVLRCSLSSSSTFFQPLVVAIVTIGFTMIMVLLGLPCTAFRVLPPYSNLPIGCGHLRAQPERTVKTETATRRG